ncbi:hypothetical protein Q4603_03190 [Zobellia galactanivorans]|uniref:Uncharacterized protein n=1 Tax=Zobellia galactanivorans (strain DSM 12802 / CCUG 47099 / CIP 106680 / NCIMB 13871 / Dsij) TaxID=63186 RepID=G0L291_ZOBGA|nr:MULTISPECIES: hypothetical protein [Zobellia]MBU3024490.1 hypothetical protein [Zobellia galactanivorans]MDO6807593.1 hypothetical protein [Zobellia galactanivorans]OWW25405.1 hypothetical protein B4Q04_07235 [Zobellia sp. OII3]CAZ97987.1 Hypothetical protein ZOBELLIA_3849 [Zobellia galactanivorans]
MHVPKTEQKQVFLKPYDQISDLEKALKVVGQMDFDKIVISVIGNLQDDYTDNSKELTFKETQLRHFFKELLGEDTAFNTFYNPELGRLFVAGFLVSTFLDPVGNRAIGVLSGGPYGILRGLGVSEEQALACVEKLSEGATLFVARGHRFDLEKLELKLDTSVDMDKP